LPALTIFRKMLVISNPDDLSPVFEQLDQTCKNLAILARIPCGVSPMAAS